MSSYVKPELSPDLEMQPRETSYARHNASGFSLASLAPSQPNVSMATDSLRTVIQSVHERRHLCSTFSNLSMVLDVT